MARRYQLDTAASPFTLTDLAGNPLPPAEQERAVRKLARSLGFT